MHTIGFNRRTATKVRDGKVQRKNRHQFTTRLGYVLDRKSPKRGFRHVVTKRDLADFTGLIPDWDELSVGLERIVLGGGDPDEKLDGFYEHFHRELTGTIVIHAWHGELWTKLSDSYYHAHEAVLSQLQVRATRERDSWLCFFNLGQARAFLLLHVFMHELGHHHDRMKYRQQDRCRGGEVYAENFANSRFPEMLPRYVACFGAPALAD